MSWNSSTRTCEAVAQLGRRRVVGVVQQKFAGAAAGSVKSMTPRAAVGLLERGAQGGHQ